MSESIVILDRIDAQLDELAKSLVTIKSGNVAELIAIADELESKLQLTREKVDELRRTGFQRSAESLQIMTNGLWQLGQAVAKLRETR